MNYSAKEDDNREELHKFLDAWSLGKDGVSFKANITPQMHLSENLVAIDALGNIHIPSIDRQFRVTREKYHFDQAARSLEIEMHGRGAKVSFTPLTSD